MIRNRSSLGFFFLTKVPLVAFDLATRRGCYFEDVDLRKNFNFLTLPKMTRRRLYSRLLVLSSGSTFLAIPYLVSMFTRRQALTRKAQITLRHNFLTFFSSLQITNKYILIDAPHTMAQLRAFRLNVWLCTLNAACRFIYTSINLTIPLLGLKAHYWLFYLWTLSWHFRYFRMPPQPLLAAKQPSIASKADLFKKQTCTPNFRYDRWLLLGFRVQVRSTPILLVRVLDAAMNALPLKEITRELTYMTISPRQTRLHLHSVSAQTTLPLLTWGSILRLMIYTYLQLFRTFSYTLLQ
uniref:hypothetical protein n=1 Tax=Euplotes vannus TaxID=5939 RepID=UPI002E774B82|nr:hypothetical protein V3A05_mgp22 [Euplotes vannus]UPM52106.1 hypothetical protein [Euplotes vannus]